MDSESAAGKSWRFKYNENEQLDEVIRPDNRKVEYQYDKSGKLKSKKIGKKQEQFEYNYAGDLTRISDDTGITQIKRDVSGRLKKMVYPRGEELLYKYNENGEIMRVSWGNNHFLKFYRDLLGNTIRMETPAGLFKMSYDYNKRVRQRIYPNGAFSEFQYNREGRPVRIRHALPNGHLVYEFSYSYDDGGLLKIAKEGSSKGELTIHYTYDEYEQLIKAEYSDGRVYSYQYDSFGNRVKYSSPAGTFSATYDTHDRLQTWQDTPVRHDAVGNVTAFGESTYIYDVDDALINDGSQNYQYNAFGWRVSASGKGGTTDYIHFIDDLPYVLVEKGKTNKRYLWNEGQCLGQIEGNRNILYFFEDHLGSIRCAVDNSGNLVGYAEYSPFGIPIERIPGVRFGYAGEEQDETGKVYLRARYYEPEIGRFLIKDRVGIQLLDSIKQNRYAYAANSPVNYTDSNGAYPNWNRNYWNNWTSGRYLGSGFGTDAAKYWANRYVQTNNPMYAIPGVVASLWTEDTFWKTGLTLAGGWTASAILPSVSSKLVATGVLLGSRGEPFYLPIVGKLVHYGIGRFGPHIGIGARKAFLHLYSTHINIGGARGINFPGHMLPGIVDEVRGVFQNLINLGDRERSPENELSILPDDKPYDDLRNRIPPPFPPGGGGGGGGMIATPNVGGVYLDKAAEVIGDLSSIEGVAFDPVSNRVILVGEDNEKKELPSIRLDDLAAAFRTVFGDYTTEPGVTIDPNPKNPRAKQMIVRFFGGMENTHFGHVLFEADRFMKSLSLGTDNISGKKVKADVKDYYNMLDLAFSNLGGRYNKDLWSRFWLVPEQVIVRVSEDKKSITFPDTRIRIKTETMRWQKGKLVPAKGEKDETAEYFAAHFTKYYDEYAKEFPVYRELKNLTNLVALAKWLKEAGVNADFAWLKKYDKPGKTPDKTPSLTVRDSRQFGGKIENVSIFGGTDLNVKNRYVKDDGTAAEYAKKALQTVASLPGTASGRFIGKKNKIKKVVALPTWQTRSGGAKMIREEELELVARSYCSFHNDTGPFGHSWIIDLPELEIRQPYRGKKEYTGVGKTKVLVRHFSLKRPFGLLDVNFKKHTVDQQYGTIAFLPEKRMGIRALYPDDKKGEFRIEYENGSFALFDSWGKIKREAITESNYREYFYDALSRLGKVELIRQGKVVNRLLLFYDKQGHISLAETFSSKIRYIYDTKGNLVKVEAKEKVIEYVYENRHLLTGIRINGEAKAEFAYDDIGRLLTETDKAGNPVKKEIKNLAGKVEITESIGNQKSKWIYDAGGRLLEALAPSGDKVKIAYYEMGSPEVMEYTHQSGHKERVEYSPDNRQMKYTGPDGEVRAFLFDELGRLTQVQDEKSALLTRKYGKTDRGWLEETQTPGKTIRNFLNSNDKSVETLLTSNIPGGGQIQVKNNYHTDGTIRQKKISGLVNEILKYENGRLKGIHSGGADTHFQYDSEGRLESMNAKDFRVSYEYGDKDTIKAIKVNKGSREGNYLFSSGRLTGRRSISGRDDVFRYDKEGRLESIKKGKDEGWQIEHKGNRMIMLRNGKRYLEAVYDNKGRVVEVLE
ncbi:MAG: RHS repeat-associated core domain-containing protein [Candidatus Aminicenantes bacterium]|nr:RHS repeat-associated core domain-containing protein [Candidatus Aminicenantes bacterium]